MRPYSSIDFYRYSEPMKLASALTVPKCPDTDGPQSRVIAASSTHGSVPSQSPYSHLTPIRIPKGIATAMKCQPAGLENFSDQRIFSRPKVGARCILGMG